MQANTDIRAEAKRNGVFLWEIASRYGVNDGNFSRKLRKELPPEEKEKSLQLSRNWQGNTEEVQRMETEHLCDMLRPRAVIERLNRESIGGLTEYTLYRLLKTGAIPARKPGRCYLVSYAAVLDYLRCSGGGDIVPGRGILEFPAAGR